MLSKLKKNVEVLETQWRSMVFFVKRDWEKGTFHSRTAGVHAEIIEHMPRLWFYKFWPQWIWVGWMVNKVYFGG